MAAATVVPPSCTTSPVIGNLKLLNHDNNYEDWMFRVKTYLVAEDLWDVMESRPPEGKDAELKAWRKNDARALYTIQSSCGEEAYSYIKGITTTKDAWNILSEKFKKPDDPSEDQGGLPTLDIFAKYQEWSVSMKNYLLAENLWNIIELAESPDDFDEFMVWNEGNDKALDAIRRACDDNTRRILGHKCKSAKVAWDALAKRLDVPTKGLISETFLELFSNNWDNARKYLLEHPEAASARDSMGRTALYHAVLSGKLDIAEELVRLMSAEGLEIQSCDGCTAFYYCVNTAAVKGDRKYIELAKRMVEKNTNLLGIVPDYDKRTPLVLAHAMEKGEEFALFLYHNANHVINLEPEQASEIVSQGIRLRRFDVAWNLLQTYQDIPFTENMSSKFPFAELAGLRSPITLSEQRLRFWERWIYSCIQIKPSHADYINVRMTDNDQAGFSVKAGLVPRLLQVLKGLKLFGINRIYKIKVIHVRFFEFLQWSCEEAKKREDIKDLSVTVMKGKQFLRFGIFRAVEQGHAEFVTHMCKAIPRLLHVTNDKGMTVLQFAAECRQEKIYSLIYGLPEEKQKDTIAHTDFNNNNMLHVIASFSSSKQINRIRGAALQMQRELQWFKEVESIARPADLEISNRTDEMTPRELFTKSHKELVRAGEMSMKETATACTVVGALIVTMMFAAVSTVPGGNGDTGLPILLYEKMFITFMVSDAVSLFSSTTSVIMFLGILTSRYAEEDFLVSLPTRMIIGLFTLFLGIVAMMVAFSSAMFIMLHGNMTVIIPVVVLACVPVISFVWMQLPFLVEIFVSTYGGSVFDKTDERWTV